jgi:hypothetical protein
LGGGERAGDAAGEVHIQGRRVRRALLGAAAALAFSPAPAHAAALLVDDDGADCPDAPFTSIQAAVDAAAAGDTVAVCPGTYVEGDGGTRGLVIAKSLSIRGTAADEVTIQPAGGVDNSIFVGPTGAPPLRDDEGNIVTVTGATVTISGVTVRAADVAVETGIAYLNARGAISNVRVTDLVQSEATGGQGRLGVSERGYGIVALSTADAGDFPIAIASTEVSGYNRGGVLVDSADESELLRSGSHVVATIRDSVIQGAGGQPSPVPQSGVQVSWSAAGAIAGSAITDNLFPADPLLGVGLFLFDADTARSRLTSSNVERNSFGVLNVDAAFSDDPETAGILDARGIWWGSPTGPALEVPTVGRGNPVTANTVLSISPSAAAFAEPAAAGPPADAPPAVRITGPGNGATLAASAPPIAVTAAATDDVAVQRVVFRAGTSVIGVDATPPYTAPYAPGVQLAGTTQAITATALDHSGQASVAGVSVRIAAAAAAVAGTAVTSAVDRPPSVAFASPANGAVVRGGAAQALAANAADDRGVARVTFLQDGRTVCTDQTAPYRCSFRPRGDDVGRNALSAVATDTAGQTAAASRAVRVARFEPRGLTARATPSRDRTRPWRFRITGRLALPAGVTRRQACTGAVSVRVERGSSVVSRRRARLRPDCSYTGTVELASRRRPGRLTLSVRFLGNTRLDAVDAPERRIRAG